MESKYETNIKEFIDKALSLLGLVLLSPIFVLISIAVFIDDPGSVFFAQKRIGKDKKLFMLHKFRTMKVNTPHDVPTHMLDNPERYITRVGGFLRRTSLDELPQIWDILRGRMSIVGPRPALYNQEDLVRERDKYGANDIKPGLTGYAQIKGRDELSIEEKASYDGKYVRMLKKGGVKAFFFDVLIFIKTIINLISHEGVVEGGTGSLE